MEENLNQTSTAAEPLRMRLHQDPSKGDPPRDVRRAILRVVPIAEGAVVEGHYLPGPGTTHYIEVYEDRVASVMALVETDLDREDRKMAQRLAQAKIDRYVQDALQGFSGGEEERKIFLERTLRICPHHWAQELEVLKRDGRLDGDRKRPRELKLNRPMPLLKSAEVIEAGLPAPFTPETAARAASQDLAAAITAAIEMAGKNKGKPARE